MAVRPCLVQDQINQDDLQKEQAMSRLQSSTRCAADISQTTKLQGIDRSPPYHELALDVGISNSLAVILGTKKG